VPAHHFLRDAYPIGKVRVGGDEAAHGSSAAARDGDGTLHQKDSHARLLPLTCV
jgi:hypothetical protein